MRNYKNYEVWQCAHEFAVFVYKEIVPVLPKSEQYELCSQLRRAASSIPMNIAEGCGRFSETEFARFLDISLGSAHETEYCLLLLKDLGYISSSLFERATNKIAVIKSKLINLIKTIRKANIIPKS